MFKMKLLCLFKWVFTLAMIYNTVILVIMKKPFADMFSESYEKMIKYIVNVFNIRELPYYLQPEVIDRFKQQIYDVSVYSNFVLLALGLFLHPIFYFVYGLKYLIFTTICSNVFPFDLNDKTKLEMIGFSIGIFGVTLLLSGCKYCKSLVNKHHNGSADNLCASYLSKQSKKRRD